MEVFSKEVTTRLRLATTCMLIVHSCGNVEKFPSEETECPEGFKEICYYAKQFFIMFYLFSIMTIDFHGSS